MTFGDHVEFFDRELVALGRKPMALTLPQIIAALDTNGSPDADTACTVFAETLTWPNGMTDTTRLEVCLRLQCARWYCIDLEDAEDDGDDGKKFLESLLIEYWHDVGRVDWIHEHFVKEWAERNFPGSTETPK